MQRPMQDEGQGMFLPPAVKTFPPTLAKHSKSSQTILPFLHGNIIIIPFLLEIIHAKTLQIFREKQKRRQDLGPNAARRHTTTPLAKTTPSTRRVRSAASNTTAPAAPPPAPTRPKSTPAAARTAPSLTRRSSRSPTPPSTRAALPCSCRASKTAATAAA